MSLVCKAGKIRKEKTDQFRHIFKVTCKDSLINFLENKHVK